MIEYNPDVNPAPTEWPEFDESERLAMIVACHECSDLEEPDGSWQLHALMHCVVENQLAQDLYNVRQTLAKLIRQDLSRHDAIHAIALVASEEPFDLAGGKRVFDEKRFKRRLDK